MDARLPIMPAAHCTGLDMASPPRPSGEGQCEARTKSLARARRTSSAWKRGRIVAPTSLPEGRNAERGYGRHPGAEGKVQNSTSQENGGVRGGTSFCIERWL